MRLVVELENFWAISTPQEGGEWAAAFLAAAGDGVPAGLRARALRVQGGMHNISGDIEHALERWEQGLAIHRSLGDERGVAIMLHRLAGPAAATGDWSRARTLAEESLAGHRRVGWRKGEPQALSMLADCAQAEGDLERALELLDESARISGEIGFDWWHAGALAKIAAVSLELGRTSDAAEFARRSLAISSAIQDKRGVVYQLALLSEIAAVSGDRRRAGVLWGAGEAENERSPVGRWLHGVVDADRVLRYTDADFEAGRADGRRLELDDAVAYASTSLD